MKDPIRASAWHHRRIMRMDKLKWETTLKWHRNKNNSSATFSYLNNLGKCLFPKLLTKHLRHDCSCPVRLKPSYIVSRTCYHFLIYMYTGELELYRDQPYQVVSGDHSDRWAEAMQALCLLAIAVNRAWVFTASRSRQTSSMNGSNKLKDLKDMGSLWAIHTDPSSQKRKAK